MSESTAELEAPPKSNKLMLILIITVVVLILLVAGVGAYLIASSGSEPQPVGTAVAPTGDVGADGAVPPPVAFTPKNVSPPKFVTMRPAFTANFMDGDEVRYLQIQMDLMARDEEVVEKIKENEPIIRHQFNKILAAQDATILTQESKDKMEAELLEAAKQIIHNTNKTTPQNVEAVFFTSFVVQ